MNFNKIVLIVTLSGMGLTVGCKNSQDSSGAGGGSAAAETSSPVSDKTTKPSRPSELSDPTESTEPKDSESFLGQKLPRDTAELADFIAECTSPLQLPKEMAYVQSSSTMSTWFDACADATPNFAYPSHFDEMMRFAAKCFVDQSAPMVLSASQMEDSLETCTFPHLEPEDVKPSELLTANIVDPNQLRGISKFRSCCGHNYSGNGEFGSNMKHYFYTRTRVNQTTDQLAINAPCDGKIKRVEHSDQTLACYDDVYRGSDVKIVCEARPEVEIRIFHVNALVKDNDIVHAGDRIGFADMRSCDGKVPTDPSKEYFSFDVAINVLNGQINPSINVSYFEWLSDEAFSQWKDWIPNPDETIILKEVREKEQCIGSVINGELFFTDPDQCAADKILNN